jgi:hypothetical protein
LTVELRGYDRLERKLGAIEAKRIAKGVLMAAGKDMEGYTAPYPAARGGNGRCWYERGFGTRWRRKDGSIHGRQTSEGLGRRWEVKPINDLSVSVGNNASYAPYVHDAEAQAGVHKGRWKTIQDAVKDRGQHVIDLFREAIEAAWRG